MWTEEYVLCGDCGCELRMVTDGRDAVAYTTDVRGNDAQGVTARVWRDGLSLVVSCPTERDGLACGYEVRFDGEGNSIDVEQVLAARPILLEVP